MKIPLTFRQFLCAAFLLVVCFCLGDGYHWEALHHTLLRNHSPFSSQEKDMIRKTQTGDTYGDKYTGFQFVGPTSNDEALKNARAKQSQTYVDLWAAMGVHKDYPMAVLLGDYPKDFDGHPKGAYTLNVQPIGGVRSLELWDDFHNHKVSLPHYASHDDRRSCLIYAGYKCEPTEGEAPTPMKMINSTGNALHLSPEGYISGGNDGRGWSKDRSIIVPALPSEWIHDDGYVNYIPKKFTDVIGSADDVDGFEQDHSVSFPYLTLPSSTAPKNWNPHKLDSEDTYDDWSIDHNKKNGIVKIVTVNVTHFYNDTRMVPESKDQRSKLLDVPTQYVSLAMARLMLAMAYRTGNYEPPKWLTDEERQAIRNADEHIPGLRWERRTWLIWNLLTN